MGARASIAYPRERGERCGAAPYSTRKNRESKKPRVEKTPSQKNRESKNTERNAFPSAYLLSL